MKILMAILTSMLSVWLFYFLVETFFVDIKLVPIFLSWLAALILFLFSRDVKHVISRCFFIMGIESLLLPLAAFLHTLNGDKDFLHMLLENGNRPDFIRYLISSNWETESLVWISLAFTLVFSLFSFFLSPERDKAGL